MVVARCGLDPTGSFERVLPFVQVADIQRVFSSESMSWPQIKWVVLDKLLASPSRSGIPDLPAASPPDSVAFLQFTSGSTSEPKGVMITHNNLAHNLSLIVHELGATTDTVVVSWLPQYVSREREGQIGYKLAPRPSCSRCSRESADVDVIHVTSGRPPRLLVSSSTRYHDMGLIGSYLGALYCGGCGYYMSPFAFIKNPSVWVESISKYRATHMQAPNFAYTLCARKFSTMRTPPTLDLSCVRHMINAAEPVDEQAIDAFVAVFTPHGLPAGVIFPTYGLAEHTVFVCSGGSQRLLIDKVALEREQRVVLVDGSGGSTASLTAMMIGCGYPFRGDGVDVAIVEDDVRLEEDHVGEIWVHSPSKAAGYWNLPEQSREDFEGSLKADAEKCSAGERKW